MDNKHRIVLEYIQGKKLATRTEIRDNSGLGTSDATIKRIISDLLKEDWIISLGKGKATTYTLAPKLEILFPMAINSRQSKMIEP